MQKEKRETERSMLRYRETNIERQIQRDRYRETYTERQIQRDRCRETDTVPPTFREVEMGRYTG